jgi:hypothetical protein
MLQRTAGLRTGDPDQEQYEEDGFKYHPALGISRRGQSASDAWKEVDRLAEEWRIPVVIEFWWQQNPRRNTRARRPWASGILVFASASLRWSGWAARLCIDMRGHEL